MTANISSLTIKIVGFWNDKIFNPKWFFDNFQSKDYNFKLENVETFFNTNERNFAFNILGVKIETTKTYIEIIIGEDFSNSEKIRFATYIARRILKLLPHTPIAGIGFNIVYLSDFENPFSELLLKNIVSFKDYNIAQYTLKKNHSNYLENIVVSKFDDSKIRINFNFEFKTIIDFDKEILINFIEETKKIIK